MLWDRKNLFPNEPTAKIGPEPETDRLSVDYARALSELKIAPRSSSGKTFIFRTTR